MLVEIRAGSKGGLVDTPSGVRELGQGSVALTQAVDQCFFEDSAFRTASRN